MLTRCLAAVCALVVCSLACAQTQSFENHLVDESRVQAKLRNGLSVVSVPLHGLQSPYKARINLEWLDPNDKPTPSVEQQITVRPAGFLFEAPLPLPASNALLARLRYRLIPEPQTSPPFQSRAASSPSQRFQPMRMYYP